MLKSNNTGYRIIGKDILGVNPSLYYIFEKLIIVHTISLNNNVQVHYRKLAEGALVFSYSFPAPKRYFTLMKAMGDRCT